MKKRYISPNSKMIIVDMSKNVLLSASNIPVSSDKGGFDVKEEKTDWNVWDKETQY